MALYQYFQPVDNLPDPKGPLSLTVKGITKLNEAVQSVAAKAHSKRHSHIKTMLEQQAKIAEHSMLHDNPAAILHFLNEMNLDLKKSSIRTWKAKYLAEIDQKC